MTYQQLSEVIARGDLDTVHCACCGQWAFRCDAVIDEGEYKSEEEGRTFYYCSVECRERH